MEFQEKSDVLINNRFSVLYPEKGWPGVPGLRLRSTQEMILISDQRSVISDHRSRGERREEREGDFERKVFGLSCNYMCTLGQDLLVQR